MNNIKQILLKGIWHNNLSSTQLLGLCPLLAVSNTATNALELGFAITLALTCTNIIVSILRQSIPSEIRIPIYLMIISSVVSVIHMIINAYAFNLYQSLGIFISLIITNCTISDQTENYNLRRSLSLTALDSLAIGLGSTCTLLFLGMLRELLGNGTLFKDADQLLYGWISVLHIEVFHTDTPFLLAILPPGAFIGLGFMLAGKRFINQQVKRNPP